MAGELVTSQNALVFAISSGFKLHLEEKLENSLSKDLIDYMLKVIKNAFQSGPESKGLKRNLAFCLLHDASSQFLIKVFLEYRPREVYAKLNFIRTYPVTFSVYWYK